MTNEEISMKTKIRLADALKKAMAKKPLSKVTVSELIRECNINRKTFYYHFEDIYGLLKWCLEQDAIEVVKSFDLLIDYEEALHFVIRYVTENAHILNCAYDSIGRDQLKLFLYNDFIALVGSVIDNCEAANGLSVSADFKRFLCDFLTEGIAGMLVNAFKDKQRTLSASAEVTKYASAIINSLPDMLKRAPQTA